MVKIKKINIQNFRIHKNISLDFIEGTNLILGENGTGKTSIFLAIIYCLFGAQALTSYEKGKRKNNLVRRGSSSGFVELEIENNNEILKIKRYVPSGDAYIARIVNGKEVKIVVGSDNVTKYVLKNFFGVFNINRIINILFIRQRTLGNLILETGKKTFSEKLEEILDLKKYTELYEILKSLLNDIQDRILETRKEIVMKERNINNILKGRTIEELENIVNKRKEVENKLKELEILKAKKQSLEKFIDKELLLEEEKIEEEIEFLKESIKKVDEELSNLKKELKYLKIVREDFKDLLSKNIKELFNLRDTLKRDVEGLDKDKLLLELKEIEERLRELSLERYFDLENKLKELSGKYKKILNEKVSLESRKDILEKILDIIKNSKDPRCPICNSILEDVNRLYMEKEKELKEILEKIKEKSILLNKIEEDLNNKQKEFLKIKEHYEYLKRKLMVDIPDHKEFVRFVKEYLKDIKEKYEKAILYDKVISAISYIKKKRFENTFQELLNLRKEYERRLEILVKKITKIKEMKKRIAELEEINKKLKELGIKDLDKEINKLKEELNKLPDIGIDALENLKKELEELNDLKKYLERIKKYYETLKIIAKILHSFRFKLRKEIANKLSNYLDFWFKRIYIYPDIKEIKIKIVEGKTDYVYEIFVRKVVGSKEVEVPLSEAGLSGGQLVVIDLALRLALASFISKNIYFILLDEPTESLDERIRRKLSEILKNLKDIQIIISTHDEIFKEALSGKGYYLKRKGNEIEVKEIS